MHIRKKLEILTSKALLWRVLSSKNSFAIMKILRKIHKPLQNTPVLNFSPGKHLLNLTKARPVHSVSPTINQQTAQ